MDFEDNCFSEDETCIGQPEDEAYESLSDGFKTRLHAIFVDTIKNYFSISKGFCSPIDLSKTNQYRRDVRFLMKHWRPLIDMNVLFEELPNLKMVQPGSKYRRCKHDLRCAFRQAMCGLFPDEFHANKSECLLSTVKQIMDNVEHDL